MKLKKILSLVSVVGILILSATGLCFAADPETAETPAYITIPAAELDYTVSERVNMTGTAGSVDLTVDQLTVTNNSSVATIRVSSIAATAANGWTLVSADTDFTKVAPNAKHFSLSTDSTDLSQGPCANPVKLAPKQERKYGFTAQTGIVTTTVTDEQCANIVVTIQFD